MFLLRAMLSYQNSPTALPGFLFPSALQILVSAGTNNLMVIFGVRIIGDCAFNVGYL
jgi:hypothetical protein